MGGGTTVIHRLPLITGFGKFSPATMVGPGATRTFPANGIGSASRASLFQPSGIGMPPPAAMFQPAGIFEYPDRLEPVSYPPGAITNAFSAGGASIANAVAGSVGVQVLSGALLAGVFSSILTLVGPGVLGVLTISCVDATNRQIGLRLTVDGVVAFSAVSDAIAAANRGMVIIGSWVASQVIAPQALPFRRSLEIEVSSTLNETDLVEVRAAYWIAS